MDGGARSGSITAKFRVAVIYNGRNPGLFNAHMTKEDLVVAIGRVWDRAKQVRCCPNARITRCRCGLRDLTRILTRRLATSNSVCGRRRLVCGQQSRRGNCGNCSAGLRFTPRHHNTSHSDWRRWKRHSPAVRLLRTIFRDFASSGASSASISARTIAEDLASKIEQLLQDRELRLTYANLALRRANKDLRQIAWSETT